MDLGSTHSTFAQFGDAVFEICELTDRHRQTNKQTDRQTSSSPYFTVMNQ